jgi:hypothetical protein
MSVMNDTPTPRKPGRPPGKRFDRRKRLVFDQATDELVAALASRLSLSESAVIRLAVRRFAEQEGITLAEE